MKQQKTQGRGKKLGYLLQDLNPQEWMELREWLRSPLHGASDQFAAMLDIIGQSFRQQSTMDMHPQAFAHLLMPQRPMEPKKEQYIWVRLTQLYQQVLEFLAWKRFAQEHALRKALLLEEVCQRNLERMIPTTYEAGMQALPSHKGAAHYKGRLRLELPYSHYLAGMGFGKGGKHLDELTGALDDHFVLQRLKYACAGLLEGEPSADPDQNPLLAAALATVGSRGSTLPLVIQAYHSAFLLLLAAASNDPAAADRLQAFEALYQRPADFAVDESMDLFVHAQNACILAHRRGDAGGLDALVRLYELVLSSGVAVEQGLMQRQFFKNTVELMCRLGRWQWAEGFVQQYHNKVAHDPEGLSSLYCMSLVRFHEGNYREVVRQLYSQVSKLDGLDTGAGARLLLCQALWEVGEFEWLAGTLAGFGQYLRRHEEIEPSLRKRYLRFVKYCEHACDAMTARPDHRLKRLALVLQEIEAHEAPNAQAWLRKAIAAAMA